MYNLKKKQTFLDDKNKFFSKPRTQNIKQEIEAIDLDVEKREYSFLLENQIALEAEFLQMFAVLKKQKNELFWLYCYHNASLLENFYKAYSQQTKEANFRELKEQIKNRLEYVCVTKDAEKNFIQVLERNFIDGFQNLMKIPFHLSVLRDYVAFSNISRLYWLFCRLTVGKGLFLAQELKWIENLDAILGIHTDIDKIVSVFEAPNGVLRYFSVALFLIRFIIDASLLLRHTFFPTDSEKRGKSTAYDRFIYEFNKRHCNFANDLVWASINFLTNFNDITHISGPLANGITAAFLGFDVCMALYKCYLANQSYLVKKAQYDREIMDYNCPLKFKELTPEARDDHITVLKAQTAELFMDLKTKEATFYFCASAASLLMLGFSATLIFSPAGIIFASYFMCHMAIAMYLSAGTYSKYTEKSLRLEQAELKGQDLIISHKELNCARSEFIFTILKNATIPMVLITTFALYWPAALALTALYLGYELLHSYDQYSKNKELEHLSITTFQ